jgi:hypothetical protein
MRLHRIAPLAALFLSCSVHPTSPSRSSQLDAAIPTSAEGVTGAASIGVERLRLRHINGSSIVTDLASGQVIDIATDTAIDIWAEIRRLESDRARLVVDWGDGAEDHAGCGSCRLDHVYQRPGRYDVFARVLDLNAAAGSNAILAIRFTLIARETRVVSCNDSVVSFSEFADNTPLPITSGGATFSGNGRVSVLLNAFAPELELQAIEASHQDLVIEYSSDHTSFSAGVLTGNAVIFSYRAFNAEGALVSAGPIAPSTVLGGGAYGKGRLQFTSEPYRRVVLTPPIGAISSFSIDNLVATCR